MKSPGVALCILLSTALAPLVPAQADSLTDPLGPEVVAVGEARRADARGGAATALNPAGVALSRELVFEGSFGYRLEGGGLALTVSGCDSTVPLPGCYYYRYTTAAPEGVGRRIHEGGVAFGRAITGGIYAGLGIKYFDDEPQGEDGGGSSGFSLDAGLVVRPLDLVSVAAVGYNLTGPSSSHYPRAVAGGLRVRPLGALAVSVDALWNLDTGDAPTGRYGGGAEYFLSSASGSSGFPLRAGVVHDVTQGATHLTAGVGLSSFKVAVDVGARMQVSGGDELALLASLRLFGPRQVPGTSRFR